MYSCAYFGIKGCEDSRNDGGKEEPVIKNVVDSEGA